MTTNNLFTNYVHYKTRHTTTILNVGIVISFAAIFLFLSLWPFYDWGWKYVLVSFLWFIALGISIYIHTEVQEKMRKLCSEHETIVIDQIKNNKRFLKKHGKYFSKILRTFGEIDSNVILKTLIGLKFEIGGKEIFVKDESVSKYVFSEIKDDISNYVEVDGVYKIDFSGKWKNKLADRMVQKSFDFV